MTVSREHYSTEAPICPHCDYKHEHDGNLFYDESLTEYQCEHCDKVFNVDVYTSTSWATSIPKGTSHDRD